MSDENDMICRNNERQSLRFSPNKAQNKRYILELLQCLAK